MDLKVITEPRIAAPPEGTVVLLIGLRINKFRMVHRWMPVIGSMIPMLIELRKNKDHGFLYSRAWFNRTVIMVQYWRSMDDLMRYSHRVDGRHRTMWAWFNRAVRDDGAVGIFHEAYIISPDRMHSVYRNMPRFGMAAATDSAPQRQTPPVPGERHGKRAA
ncbi:DUF4188 domain-containing protein [Streptomyces sp. NPDC057877]|uniref:DUF4188 domain-containing protein n=1 Tax=Streptomyces sp. NPDC057877 TaxID=3346269 RepID=UPI00367709EB